MKGFSLILTLSLLITAALSGCLFDCKNVTIQSAPSPNGLMVATVFSRDCGATTSVSVQVYLGAAGEKVPQTGNVFRGTGSPNATVKWHGNDVLEISSDAKPFLLMKQYGSVGFEFVQSGVKQP